MRFSFEKILIFVLILAILGIFIFVVFLFFGKVSKDIKITFPSGGEELRVGDTYQIAWKSRGVEKIGIVLFKDQTPKWIVKNIDASLGFYEWKIYPGQDYGDNFWIALVEFPWRDNGKVSYTDGSFAIAYSQFNSCDNVSIEKQWPFVPSDYPNIRRVFITQNTFTGNLGGLDGGDKKCQEDAKSRGYSGVWRAFIGGDSDKETAVERFKKMPRQFKGIFVEAKSDVKLESGITCHTLLGKDFNEFLANFSGLEIMNKQKFSSDFFNDFSNVWLGRLNERSKASCVKVYDSYSLDADVADEPKNYSYTSTCQRWTNENQFVNGYSDAITDMRSFPACYTSFGKSISAVAVAGLSTGKQGKEEISSRFVPSAGRSCDTRQKLLCVEE